MTTFLKKDAMLLKAGVNLLVWRGVGGVSVVEVKGDENWMKWNKKI